MDIDVYKAKKKLDFTEKNRPFDRDNRFSGLRKAGIISIRPNVWAGKVYCNARVNG